MTASIPGSVWSVALAGMDGQVLEIRAQLHDAGDPAAHSWQPEVTREVRERVRAAIRNSELAWPNGLVTLTVSPAASPTGAPGCDLALACAVLAADGLVPTERLDQSVLLGELALDGRIRPVPGVLPALLAAHRAGLRQAVVPSSMVQEAALYVCYLVAGLLDEAADLTENAPPKYVRESGTGELRVLIARVTEEFPYFWFLFNDPPLWGRYNYCIHRASDDELAEWGHYGNVPTERVTFDQHIYGHLGNALRNCANGRCGSYRSPLG